ncbi:type 2 isopentenyl-diphosphate Delta-isomerase [Pullulanibacillus sp. KACC 23026]|uniref:type 2 isopentenyl-diphosphate Delta-isomerase n=1 Tax=Pullulanibacillus sp. KACC 23026 TaxID=3028315 RepID=UPI0023AF9AE7|nr:type 2 isopentenyl-diphosphate Delta-isomerase [Pullulanibacillus sp. KACC 23026]WEG14384.1 type 2 isopentenyl-diphosphate Delta-isomerase [Pullulanibacillus sp. KACC 23026]
MSSKESIEARKNSHIDVVLTNQVTGENITNGFDRFRFTHQALPEINFSDIHLDTVFLEKTVKTPFLISSMTGGTERAWKINRHLAEAAEVRGWTMGVGSSRIAIEQPDRAYSFKVREVAPSIPLIANLGAVQLNKGYRVNECRRIVESLETDALVLHLNSLQEVIQTNGDTEFKGLFKKIEQLCRELEVPLGVKEVGWGVNGQLAKSLFDIGVAFVDVAGAGGTSWTQVEKIRSQDPIKRKAAEIFTEWGIPTAECLIEAKRANVKGPLIASGGMLNGLDAAKALGLGAQLVGFGRRLLAGADESTEAVLSAFETIEMELKMVMFAVGHQNVESLRKTPHLKQIVRI